MQRADWNDMMGVFGFAENPETYQALIKAHDEPHRHYHTQDHIDACLSHVDTVELDMERPHEVRLAFWFHDAIYKIFSGTNEKDSAAWAVEFLRKNGAADDVIARIENLILITEHHASSSRQDERFMLDIDLSILGAPPYVYDQFEVNIRKEYKRVPKIIFNNKRKQILQGFLDMEGIYKTDVFKSKLEQSARENLIRTIAGL